VRRLLAMIENLDAVSAQGTKAPAQKGLIKVDALLKRKYFWSVRMFPHRNRFFLLGVEEPGRRRVLGLTNAACGRWRTPRMSRQDKFEASQIEPVPSEYSEHADQLQIDLRLKLGEVAHLEAELLRRNAHRQPTRQELARIACKIFDARRSRDRILDKERQGLFREPAWDMLLALYCLPTRGELLTITSLTYAAEIPQATGHRWQKILMDNGLIERGPDTCDDLRKRFVRLTPRGKSLMQVYLTRLFYSDLPVPPVPEQISD